MESCSRSSSKIGKVSGLARRKTCRSKETKGEERWKEKREFGESSESAGSGEVSKVSFR